jgi:hypothetical protein
MAFSSFPPLRAGIHVDTRLICGNAIEITSTPGITNANGKALMKADE